MTRVEVHAVLGDPERQYRKGSSETITDCYHANQLQVAYAADDRVEYIELNGPGAVLAEFNGKDLLSMEAEEAVAHVTAVAKFDPDDPEIGYSYVFPSLDLALWRPVTEGPEGRTFRSVGVARAGYFADT